MCENLLGLRGIISIIKVEKFLWFYSYENHLDFILPHYKHHIRDVIGVSQQSTHITCADARFVNKT